MLAWSDGWRNVQRPRRPTDVARTMRLLHAGGVPAHRAPALMRHTEASHRFERGTDPEACPGAAAPCAKALMARGADGRVHAGDRQWTGRAPERAMDAPAGSGASHRAPRLSPVPAECGYVGVPHPRDDDTASRASRLARARDPRLPRRAIEREADHDREEVSSASRATTTVAADDADREVPRIGRRSRTSYAFARAGSGSSAALARASVEVRPVPVRCRVRCRPAPP